MTITVVSAIFAAGTIVTLLMEGRIAGRFGRRGAMFGGVTTMMVAAVVLAVWKALPGLLIGRMLTGVAIGLGVGVAIPYLIDLRLHVNPDASPVPARNLGTAVKVGALGIGPLLAGFLAQWVAQPLTVPYTAMVVLGAVALVGTTGIVLEATPPENRVAMTSALVIAVFVGLSVPVIGAGIALDAGASEPNTVLGFAILVALGVSFSGWALAGRRTTGPEQPAPPASTERAR